MVIKPVYKILWGFPLVVIMAQLLPMRYSIVAGIIFAMVGLAKSFRVLLLFGFAMLGHSFWALTYQYFTSSITNGSLLVITGRFGLIGYIILFAVWERFQPCGNRYLQVGNLKEPLKFPLIWWGFNEYIWRFLLIFCFLCFIVTMYFYLDDNKNSIMLYGFLFAVINSVLEEILWRGFILGRAVDFAGEKHALILTSLAFGVYHLSLGFSIWLCLAFAVGGFYMGGCAVKGKGLCAPIVMHLFVNMVFVSIGIIF